MMFLVKNKNKFKLKVLKTSQYGLEKTSHGASIKPLTKNFSRCKNVALLYNSFNQKTFIAYHGVYYFILITTKFLIYKIEPPKVSYKGPLQKSAPKF